MKSPLHNTQVVEQLQALKAIDNVDQDAALNQIDAMIEQRPGESAMQPLDRKAS